MEKKKTTKRKVKVREIDLKKFSVLEVVILISLTALVFMFVGAFIFYKKYDGGKLKNGKNIGAIEEVYNSVLKEYYGEIDEDILTDSALWGMSKMGDSYASYIPKDEVGLNNEILDGSYIGLGVNVINNKDNYLEVVIINDDSPAKKAKIELNDIIYKVDDLSLHDVSMEDVIKYIKNSKKGDKVKLYILRNNEKIELEVELDVIEHQTVSSYIIEKNNKHIGVIKISYFSKNTALQFKKIYENLEADYLIIDLRDNKGGYLSNASNILELFLDSNSTIYRLKTKEKEEFIKSNKEKLIDKKVVLLVNNNTASSSEMFAASLKDNLKVKIIGVPTYGKGYVQKVLELSNGGLFKFSAREILTPNGMRIEGNGVLVDIYVEQNEDDKIDYQLEKAILEVLK